MLSTTQQWQTEWTKMPLITGALIVVKPGASTASRTGWQDVLMPQEPPSPTDPSRERDLGRIALWLDPGDLRWLAERCRCDDGATELDRERCARVRFRAHAALYKSTAEAT